MGNQFEIHRGSTDREPIEKAVAAAFPRGTVLRVQVFPAPGPLGINQEHWLVLVNTQRTFGHFAILEWNNSIGALHSGHYFDSMPEAVADFNLRGGDLSI